MMLKKAICTFVLAPVVMGWFPGRLNGQSLAQMGFIIKKALPSVAHIVVIYHESRKGAITSQARTATLVTKTRFHIYGIRAKNEIPGIFNNIHQLRDAALVILGDDGALNKKSVKYIAHKLGLKKIPVISNREHDTREGAFLCVIKKGEDIETHVNTVIATALEIKFPEGFLADCTIDVH